MMSWLGTLTPPAIAEKAVNDAFNSAENAGTEENIDTLSPLWHSNVTQWSPEIHTAARKYGFDPDLVAAVTHAESNGDPTAISYVGAVGLMGVMPSETGMAWRPTTQELVDPTTNLDWGTAILADIMRQSGGDIHAALAAYNGGWQYASATVPQNYADEVLDIYARAVVVRSGMSPDVAEDWTIAVELDHGVVPVEPLLMGQEPLSGLYTYGEHTLFAHTDAQGRSLHIRAFAVPVAVIKPLAEHVSLFGESDTLEPALMARLGEGDKEKLANNSPQVLLACLPSLDRLRGRLTTRWFSPSSCPQPER
jgi:hypothetical protein